MFGAESWVEPIPEWSDPLDGAPLQERLRREGELLTTWPAAPFESAPTDCYRLANEYWICQGRTGAVCFNPAAARFTAFPFHEGDPSWFREIVARSWLPAIYPFWGRQVVHASAIGLSPRGDAVAFTGATQAGKSTIAYGLAQRPGWRLLADDTLAFSAAGADGLRLYPLKGAARLRPASADYFGQTGQTPEPVVWPPGPLTLKAVYALEGDEGVLRSAEFTRLRIADALPLLLQQAYALSFEIPQYNQRLMKDYARLAASVPTFRLSYRRSFAVLDAMLDALEEHLATEVGLVATR